MIKNTICLDENYSTTRLVTQEKPEIINKSEDKFESVLFLPESEGRKGEGGLRTKGYFKKSFVDKPLISIVTVVFNGEQFLEETILSVINQSYDNVEYIIIDGGSTDGTLDIIKKYEDYIDYWVSEKDGGISNAFNKAISLSTGYKVLMLNCGDIFISNDFILVNIEKISKLEDITFFTVKVNDRKTIPSQKVKNNIKLLLDTVEIPHQGAFVKLSTYKINGYYNENFKIRMDYEFFSRLKSNDCTFKYYDKEIVKYLEGGVSMQLKNRFLFNYEATVSNYFYNKTANNISFKQKLKKVISIVYLVFKGKI
jgi:glycosyltransferase involved in cell wall biosynthesis